MTRETGIQNVSDDPQKVERALLVGVQFPNQTTEDATELLTELVELVDTMGVPVVGQIVVRLRKPQPRFLVGDGKAQELVEMAQQLGADVIIFDDYLSPSQQRNWEELAELAVIDRQEVILDIFAQRAQTSEAALQVDLARANYELPRLRRRWTHLHRQRGAAGGMGMRGEGEQQIEVDSRMTRRRIARLKAQLEEVLQHRRTQRARRQRQAVPVAAIVGYTNSGKSSLLNVLTNAQVLAENKLFATLDPTIRRIDLPNNQPLLLADTVGFIRKLPHQLVEAFKSTLEETALADLLIEVVDITGRTIEEKQATTREVLTELGAADKPAITVFNKIDLLGEPFVLRRWQREFPDAVFISALTGEGLPELVERLAKAVAGHLRQVHLIIPHQRYDLMARLHEGATLFAEAYEGDGIHVSANVPPELYAAVLEYVVTAPDEPVDSPGGTC